MGEGQLLLLLRLLLLPTVLLGCLDCAEASTADIYKGARLGHRIVQTRYGRLHGLILPLDSFRFLRSVEVFLGVPYATPPTKQNRYVGLALKLINEMYIINCEIYFENTTVILALQVKNATSVWY